MLTLLWSTGTEKTQKTTENKENSTAYRNMTNKLQCAGRLPACSTSSNSSCQLITMSHSLWLAVKDKKNKSYEMIGVEKS